MEEDTGKLDPHRRRDRPHPRCRLLAGRLQPRRHPAHRDRHQARSSAPAQTAPSRGQGVRRRSCATDRREPRCLRRPDGPAATIRCDVNLSLAPARAPTNASAPAPRRRTSTRCARSSAPCATRSSATRGILDAGEHGRPGDPPLPRGHRHHDVGPRRSPTPTTTATSPSRTWCPSAPSPRVGRGAARHAARARRRQKRRKRLQAEWGFSDLEMPRRREPPARWTLIEATVAAGASAPQSARKWWMGELAAPRQRRRRRARPSSASRPAAGRRGAAAGRREDDQRQAGPPGPRRRDRR